MHEEEHFVNNMKNHMETDVVFVIVQVPKLPIHRHVCVTNKSGKNIKLTIVVLVCQGSRECYRGQMKVILGNLVFAEHFSLMTVTIILKLNERITLVLVNSTVLRQ